MVWCEGGWALSVVLGLLVTLGEGRRHKRHKHKQCRVSEEALHQWGQWASRANDTSRHLSLLSPVLPEPHLRAVTASDLHDRPMLAGDDVCPTGLNQLQADPLMNRSLCPWYWRINYDPRRIPASLPEAHCRCDRAVTGNRLFACHPLTMRVRVGRLTDACDTYVDDHVDLAVACVSVVQPELVVNAQEFANVQKTFVLGPFQDI